MAATATQYNTYTIIGGNGKVANSGVIEYDSDATVEVPTNLSYIEAAYFVEIVSGGSADLPSIDETEENGSITVPSTGKVTVDTGGNSTRKFFYTFIGY